MPRSATSQPMRRSRLQQEKTVGVVDGAGRHVLRCDGAGHDQLVPGREQGHTRACAPLSRCAMPMLAARPNSAGPKRVPAGNTQSPRLHVFTRMADVLARQGRGVDPDGLGLAMALVVDRRAVFLHDHRIGSGGTGAPVKMRAAVPACRCSPTEPAAIRCVTRSSWEPRNRSSARAAHSRPWSCCRRPALAGWTPRPPPTPGRLHQKWKPARSPSMAPLLPATAPAHRPTAKGACEGRWVQKSFAIDSGAARAHLTGAKQRFHTQIKRTHAQ